LAFIKFKSAEFAPLAVHDHIIRALANNNLLIFVLLIFQLLFTQLIVLSFWNAFHLGISGIDLNCFKSYLTSWSLHVQIEDYWLSVFQPLCGILGSLVFILLTTPASTVISTSPVHHHHQYTDNTS
jgi:hypothetical protein